MYESNSEELRKAFHIAVEQKWVRFSIPYNT